MWFRLTAQLTGKFIVTIRQLSISVKVVLLSRFELAILECSAANFTITAETAAESDFECNPKQNSKLYLVAADSMALVAMFAVTAMSIPNQHSTFASTSKTVLLLKIAVDCSTLAFETARKHFKLD